MANISSAYGTITLLGDWTQEDLDAFAPVLKSWEFYGAYGIQWCGSFAVDKREAEFSGCGRWTFDGTLKRDWDRWTRDWIENPPSKTDHPLTTEQYDHFLQLMDEKNLMICFDFKNDTGECYENDEGEIIEDFFDCKGYMYSDGKKLIYMHRNIILTEDGTGIIPEGIEKLVVCYRYDFEEEDEKVGNRMVGMVIPKSLKDIGDLHYNCNKIEKFEVSPDNMYYSTDGMCLYNKDKTELYYVSASISEFTIPEGVESIGAGVFVSCKNLMRLYIPESLKDIRDLGYFCNKIEKFEVSPDNMYYSTDGMCLYNKDKTKLYYVSSSISEFTIPEGVESIAYGAFSNCKNLMRLHIPESVTDIYAGFSACEQLSDISVSESFLGKNGIGVFEGTPWIECCQQIEDGVRYLGPVAISCENTDIMHIELRAGTTQIAGEAFRNCGNLKSITIPESVTKIGWRAFEGCKNLKNITIPEGVTEIGVRAFDGCEKLENITILEGVTEIGVRAFEGCEKLENITIPKSVTKIGWNAFRGCKNLKNISIPEGVTEIGGSAFYGCESLTGISIPESVKKIAERAFSGCERLSGIVLPEKLKTIALGICENCKSLQEIVIPDSAKMISGRAFAGCINLSSIELSNKATKIKDRAFKDCVSLHNIILPDTMKTIDKRAFEGCENLSSITIPSGVTEIAADAFGNCKNLTIHAPAGSFAESFAKEHNIPCINE